MKQYYTAISAYYQVLVLCFSLLASNYILFAHGEMPSSHIYEHSLSFVENKGQWHNNVRYRADLGNLNAVFLEHRAFTYTYFNPADVVQLHDLSQASWEAKEAFRLHGHTYKVRFLGSSGTAMLAGINKHDDYNNYFIGNDPAKWVGHADIYDRIAYDNLYSGIDLHVYSRELDLKYDFIVAAKANPYLIHLFYDGVDNIDLNDDGSLTIQTSVETIRELRPYAYQLIDGDTIAVPCRFLLSDANVVSFFFPTGYNHKLPLVIDPVVVAATLSGSTVTNYGHCATYDNDGNIYTGAISFGAGYSVSTGAFDVSFNGGGTDIAISKYNPTGTNRLFGTYIGGDSGDYPHSLITNGNNEIYVYGSSNSGNFPITANSIMDIPGGGADIVVSHLSEDGANLLGSTYIGGANNDGRNNAGPNYGDTYRGEIMLDGANNVYVASCSQSPNFPVTDNAIQSEFDNTGGGFGGAQDGVVFKLAADFNNLLFSTYLGGDGADMVYGIRVANDGSVYVCGGAGNDNFPGISPDGLFTDHSGGQYDGFVTHLNSDASAVLHGTFWGSDDNDQAYFIDLDRNNNHVLVYGQSFGTMPITAGAWGIAGGSLFISAFSANLDFPVYSTTVGSSSGGGVPVAFLIDQCGYIYFSCYSAPSGMQTTPDAVFITGGFYVGVLTPDIEDLHYATYYTANHVDGGTSRFDKRGVVYQGVCSGGDFTTNDDAWATGQIGGWDIGVFKINFETPLLIADISTDDPVTGCAPLLVNFNNNTVNATAYLWSFGDGSTATDSLVSHIFNEIGSYTVMLIATNPESCNLADTAYLLINVGTETGLDLGGPYTICETPILLDATIIGGSHYIWSTGDTIPTISTTQAGTYSVSVTTVCGIVSDEVQINAALPPQLDLGEPYIACEVPILLDATIPDAISYQWNTGATSSMLHFVSIGTYSVTVTTACGVVSDTVLVLPPPPLSVNLGDDISACANNVVILSNLSTDSGVYQWSTGANTSSISVITSGVYSLTMIDACGQIASDTVNVSFKPLVNVELGAAITICEDSTATIDATTPNVLGYTWSNGSTDAAITVSNGGVYSVVVSGECNNDSDNIAVSQVECNPLCANLDIAHLVDCTTGIPNTYTVYAAITGGTLPYIVSGSYEGVMNTENMLLTIANLPVGSTYSLSVVDAINCDEIVSDTPTCLTLPIELLRFAGEVLPQGNQLSWTTVAEVNNAYFSLYRSTDGIAFEHIATIEGAGNSTTDRQYTYFDVYTATGLVYYRLVQTDFDGNHRIVGTTDLQRESVGDVLFTLLPTINTGMVYIIVNDNKHLPQQLRVFDSSGQLVHTQQHLLPLAGNRYALDLSGYSNGMYWVEVISEGQIEILKTCKMGH